MKNFLENVGYLILNFFVGFIFTAAVLNLFVGATVLDKIWYLFLIILIIFYAFLLIKKQKIFTFFTLIIITAVIFCYGLLFIHCFTIFPTKHQDIYCVLYTKTDPIIGNHIDTMARPMEWIIKFPDKVLSLMGH